MLARYFRRLSTGWCCIFVSAICATGVARAQQPAETSVADGAVESAGDPSEGASHASAIPQRSLLELLRAGGMVMVPLVGCSFLLVVFVLERSIALRRGRIVPRPFVKRFLHQVSEGQLDREQALTLCEGNASPVAAVFAAGTKKWGRPAVEIEQAVLDAGERAVNGLRRHLRLFNGIATVSPLLGLLGTVFGMITAFNEISDSDAMGRPELLAAGISQALITTAAGLCIAIPALVAYLYFGGRVDQLTMELDRLGTELVSLISADGPRAGVTHARTRREAA